MSKTPSLGFQPGRMLETAGESADVDGEEAGPDGEDNEFVSCSALLDGSKEST